MIILIPTAKQMKKRKLVENSKLSIKSIEVVKNILKYDLEELSNILKLDIEKTKIEKNRFENISNENYEALTLFDGLMYRNIKREGLKKSEIEYLRKKVYIISALYGIINVFDSISEHRLDFNMSFKINGKSLKSHWRSECDNKVKNKTVISLLSKEFIDVFSKDISDKFINIQFYELINDKLNSHSTISKKARGKFLNELVRLNIESIEEIKKMKFDNFKYSIKHSNEKELVFIKGGE